MTKPRILIAEDNYLIRENLGLVLQSEFDVVGSVDNGPAAIDAAAEKRPEIVLLDVSLPYIKGFDVARRILAANPAVKIVFVSGYFEQQYVDEALAAGASGYVLKKHVVPDLPVAIRVALSGGVFKPGS